MKRNRLKPSYLLFPLFSILCSLFSVLPLSALGIKDADEAKYLNDEWLLCVTAFDQSQMPPARQLAGNFLTRNLVDKLFSVSYRLRISPEYAYYESYAWQQEVGTAAKALANKQNERSQLLYRGDPNWRYRQELRRVDEDIKKLAATLAEKEAQKPLIHKEPAFKLTEGNINGNYPAPPQKGGERRFCQSQKADAFLTGSVSEFHERYYIKLRLFTLYTNSWIYEDEIIFSLEDVGGAVEEIAARLTAALAGSKPSGIAVTTTPPEAQILINRNYAGRGTVPARDHPPGNIIIAAAAEGFTQETVEEKLAPGEFAEIDITLNPLQYNEVYIDTPGKTGAFVYHGAMFVGEAPLTLRLPVEQLEYVNVESMVEQAKGVFTTPDLASDPLTASFNLKIPRHAGEKRVSNARRWYYRSWGSVWITGLAAWISYGMYNTQRDVLLMSNDYDFYENTRKLYYVSMGTMIAVGVAVGHNLFQLGRYIYAATEDATPIIRENTQKK